MINRGPCIFVLSLDMQIGKKKTKQTKRNPQSFYFDLQNLTFEVFMYQYSYAKGPRILNVILVEIIILPICNFTAS